MTQAAVLEPDCPAPFYVGLRVFLDNSPLGTIVEVSWEPTMQDWVAAVAGPHCIWEMITGEDWLRCNTLLAGNRFHASLDNIPE